MGDVELGQRFGKRGNFNLGSFDASQLILVVETPREDDRRRLRRGQRMRFGNGIRFLSVSVDFGGFRRQVAEGGGVVDFVRSAMESKFLASLIV